MTPTPVRVFIASDPTMGKAEKTLEYTIRKNTSGPVEIVWMNRDLGGIWGDWNMGRDPGNPYSGKGWATDFTCFRFAIPEVAGYEGRAIYMDVDMVVLGDLRVLFEHNMQGKPLLRVGGRTDVMLIDCAYFKDKDWWPRLAAMKASGKGIGDYLGILNAHGCFGPLDRPWNTLDAYNAETKIVHYTNMRTQPWEPYPDNFRMTYEKARQNASKEEKRWRDTAKAFEEGKVFRREPMATTTPEEVYDPKQFIGDPRALWWNCYCDYLSTQLVENPV